MKPTDPPTEIEVANALDFLPKGGAIPGIDKVHDILRRLAFDRDRCRQRMVKAELEGGWNVDPSAYVAQSKYNQINSELLDERAFNEGLTEHIGDMIEAMSPFVEIVKGTSGRIPTERLSFADWRKLVKVFDAAKAAVCVNEGEPIGESK